jgi:hypothetical protein
MTSELEAEGFAREISRRVQAERKKRGLEKKDSINLKLYLGKLNNVDQHIDLIKERTGSEDIKIVDKEHSNFLKFKVKNKEFSFSF